MNFMDIFLPVTAALFIVMASFEAFHFFLGLWVSRRQQAAAEKYYKDMAEKMGVSPEDLENAMAGMQGMGGEMPMTMMGDMPPGMAAALGTTASGNDVSHGQYL